MPVQVEEEENDPMVECFTSSKWPALNINWVLKIVENYDQSYARVMRIKK